MRNEKGVTLLELLVAITLLAIILIPVGHMFLLSYQTTGATKVQLSDRGIAVDILENMKEAVRNDDSGFSYGDGVTDENFDLNCSPGCPPVSIIVDSNNYEVEYRINSFPFEDASENVSLYHIEVVLKPENTPQGHEEIKYSVIVMRDNDEET